MRNGKGKTNKLSSTSGQISAKCVQSRIGPHLVLYVLQPVWSLPAQISSLEGTVCHYRWNLNSSTQA